MDGLGVSHKAATPFAGEAARFARFYANGTHKIITSKECLVEDGRARAILNDVAYLARPVQHHAYQEDRGKGRSVMAWFAADMPPGRVLVLVVNGQHLPGAGFIAALRKGLPQADQHLLERRARSAPTQSWGESRLLRGSSL